MVVTFQKANFHKKIKTIKKQMEIMGLQNITTEMKKKTARGPQVFSSVLNRASDRLAISSFLVVFFLEL